MARGPHAEVVSEYYKHMRMLLVEAFTLGDVEVDRLRQATTKSIYEGHTTTFPPPKVVFKFDVDWSIVWRRLASPVLEPEGREKLIMIVHNIVPNKERLFEKFHMVTSPHCGL